MTTEKEPVMSQGPKRVELVHAPVPEHVRRVYFAPDNYVDRQQVGWAMAARFDGTGRLRTWALPIFDGFMPLGIDEEIDIAAHIRFNAAGEVIEWESGFDPEIGQCTTGGTDGASLDDYIKALFAAFNQKEPPSWVREITNKLDS